jgi:hypothetical protein
VGSRYHTLEICTCHVELSTSSPIDISTNFDFISFSHDAPFIFGTYIIYAQWPCYSTSMCKHVALLILTHVRYKYIIVKSVSIHRIAKEKIIEYKKN